MEIGDVLNVVAAALISVGGAGAIVVALSSWLGKVWATRLMDREKAAHARELESLRSELRKDSEAELAALRNELDIFKEKHLRGHQDKIQIYRLVVDVVAELLGDLDFIQVFGDLPEEAKRQRWDKFNRGRMRAYGYLAMLAPQPVMDASDDLFDHLIQISHGQAPYEWSEVRARVLALLNETRKDIGIDETAIRYNGML